MFTLPSPQNNSFKFSKTRQSRFHKNGWLNRDDFAETIKKERNRSNRTGLPISYISIDLFASPKQVMKLTAQNYDEILEKILNLITKNTRDFDIKHYYEPSQIGILLIDTDLQGAKSFIERISNILYKHFESYLRGEFIQFIQTISISSYPLDQMPNCNKIEGKPILINHVNVANRKGDNRLYIEQRSNLQMHWKFQQMIDGAIALNYPIMWDIQYAKHFKLISKFVKRFMDIIGSVVGIILFSPVMLFIIIAIKLTSPGPVLFKQKRYGYLGQPFVFLKFRTMECNNDSTIHKDYVHQLIRGENNKVNQGSSSDPFYKIKADPRITLFGRVLRKTSLDELPQLFNVLRGEMSLVGPRPTSFSPETYELWQTERLDVMPGITGLWQIMGRGAMEFDERVRLDVAYIERRCLWLDLQILLRTFTAVWEQRGAH